MLKHMGYDFINEVEHIIKKYELSKTNKQGFLKLREYYNINELSEREKSIVLYCLLSHSFNYQLAFNSKGEFNMPFGMNRSYFSLQMKNNLIDYIRTKGNIQFANYDFTDFPIWKYQNAFVYIDPPYLITTGAYERDYFCKWSEEYEKKLLSYIDSLDDNGHKFALSNVIEHKGRTNDLLKQWMGKYNVHYLNSNYDNCNYQTKGESTEVLITNYRTEDNQLSLCDEIFRR